MTLRPRATRPGTQFLLAFLAAATVAAVPEPATSHSPLDAATRSRLVEEIAKALETMYVDPEAGRRMAAEVRRRSADRGYDGLQTVPEFASRMTRELQELGKDKHLAVVEASQHGATVQRVVERRPAEDAGGEAQPRVVRHHGGAGGPEMERWKRTNYGVQRAERLEGNVGYLRVTGFPPGEGAKTSLAGAMSALAGTDSLIVDVRECPGGVPETVNFLASYFFGPEPVELISRYNRHTDETEKDFTLREVPGARRAETDLRILTSAHTGSACESFAYILQQHGRARVLGERTAGAGHLAARIPIGSGLVISVSVGRPIHPRTGRGWEGTGVEPDAAMAAPSALPMAHQEALSALWERASDPAQKRRLAWALEASKAADDPPPAPKLLQIYTGKYGEREITLDPDGLGYRGPGGRRWGPLLAVGPGLFAIDEEARVLFERNGRGEVTALQLMRGDGSSERVPKGSGIPQVTLAPNRAHARPADAIAGALPDSPGGRRAAALFDALASGSPEKRRKLIEDNYAGTALKEVSATERASRFADVAANHPGLTPRRVLSSEASRIVVLAEDSRGEWLEVTVWMEETPPHKILRVALEQGEREAAPREKPKGSDAEIARAVEEHLGKLAAADEFSGVVLLAKDGKPFFQKAYGLANRERKVANRLDTRFNIGSIDKTLTQVAIAQLASQRKLAFSDTIRRHLPDHPSPAGDKITIQHLLMMSSGLGDIFGDRYRAADKSRLRRLSDYLPFFADLPLLFEPGSDRKYSNAGYVVLGLIIEKVSGRDYHDYVREKILSPAGMTDSGSNDPRGAAESVAIGYTRQLGGGGGPGKARQRNTEILPARSSSAGGSYSTAADLLRLDIALRNDTLLPPEFGDWLFSDKQRAPGQRGSRSGGLGVAGGLPGGNATLEMDLDHGYSMIVLSNDDPPSAQTVARKIREWIGL